VKGDFEACEKQLLQAKEANLFGDYIANGTYRLNWEPLGPPSSSAAISSKRLAHPGSVPPLSFSSQPQLFTQPDLEFLNVSIKGQEEGIKFVSMRKRANSIYWAAGTGLRSWQISGNLTRGPRHGLS